MSKRGSKRRQATTTILAPASRPKANLPVEPAQVDVSSLELAELGKDGQIRNEVSANVGGIKFRIQWLPRGGVQSSPLEKNEIQQQGRRFRFSIALGAAGSFVLGASAASAITWELVPYIEAMKVVSELGALKLGGGVCLLGGALLYLVRRIVHK